VAVVVDTKGALALLRCLQPQERLASMRETFYSEEDTA